MCNGGAICGDNHTTRPWWPTEQRWDVKPTEKVLTDCCYRRVRAFETVCRLRLQEVPVGGYGNFHEEYWFGDRPGKPISWFTYASYYDASWRVECNPDGGCNVNPHKRVGMHLREPYFA